MTASPAIATVGVPETLTATETPAIPGTVSATPPNAAPVTLDASGVATFDIPAGLSLGEHSIAAPFTPANPAQYEASRSTAQSFFLQESILGICAEPGSRCTDVQDIEVTAGGLAGADHRPVTVATASAGLGTDTLNGTLTLNAPVSTEPGLFTGTITVTVG